MLLILINGQYQFVGKSLMQRNMHFWQASKVSTEKAEQIREANSDTVKVREFMPEHWDVHPYCSKLCQMCKQMANSNQRVMHDTQDGGHRKTGNNGRGKRFQLKPGRVSKSACYLVENYWVAGECTWELITLKMANIKNQYTHRSKVGSPKNAEEKWEATGTQKLTINQQAV